MTIKKNRKGIMKKLETTRRILTGSIIRLYRKGFGYTAVTVLDNNEYYLSALAEEEFFNYCRENDPVEAYLWVENVASYQFTLSIIGKIDPGPRVLFFSHTDKIIRSEQRKCLTATVAIPIQFFTFNSGKNVKGISSKKIVYRSGSIILLSDREAVIRSNDDLSGAKFLKGSITLKDEAIEMVGTIAPINEEKNVYNIIFTGMSDRERNRILEYVFSVYRE